MLIGMKFKLFEIVNENPSISLDDLIKQCGFGKKCGEAIITVLTATGYLKVDAGEQQQYNLTGWDLIIFFYILLAILFNERYFFYS